MRVAQLPLWHVYIGTAYQGAIRGQNAQHACARWASEQNRSSYIYNAKPAATVQQLKEPRRG